MSLSNQQCYNFAIQKIAVEAANLETPQTPYPHFFSEANCTTLSVPRSMAEVDCTDTYADAASIPQWGANCLRILSTEEISGYLKNGHVPTSKINYLYTQDTIPTHSNILSYNSAIVRSLYNSPIHRLYFFATNPNSAGDPRSGKHFIVQPNTTFPDLCLSNQSLVDASSSQATFSPFFDYLKSIDDSCDDTQKYVFHTTPYLLIEEIEPWEEVIKDMCTTERSVSIGFVDLNSFWKPQTKGCDSFMTSYCKKTQYPKEICSCFTQQAALLEEYGSDLNVPVCCFGKDPGKDINSNCFLNNNSYKTADMNKAENCCSFAECSTSVFKSVGMQENTNTPGSIQCAGNEVNFPVRPKKPVPEIREATTVSKTEIPSWIYYAAYAAAGLMFLFFIMIAFVPKGGFKSYRSETSSTPLTATETPDPPPTPAPEEAVQPDITDTSNPPTFPTSNDTSVSSTSNPFV